MEHWSKKERYTVIENVNKLAVEDIATQVGRSPRAVRLFMHRNKIPLCEKVKHNLTRQSHYYQGITGVSDTARIDLGEDNWFEEYENNVNENVIAEIVSASLFLNEALYNMYACERRQREELNPVAVEALRLEAEKERRKIALWKPRLADMRRHASFYIRASSFCNKEILGPKFFKTQLESLDMDEFLTSICAVRKKEVVNKFFAAYDRRRHQFADGYKYDSILRLDLKEHFILTSRYLKYYNRNDELLVGYDPGSFSSMVVAQENNFGREIRIIKEFFCYSPEEQPELALAFYEYFGQEARNKHIVLYPDRAANKRREDMEKITTDARILKRELESYGFSVELMNEGQATVYHWMQYKMLLMIFGERSNLLPRCLIDENECPNLCSSIPLSPLKKTDGRIELDKESEKKVPIKRHAGLTTQLPSALIYLLFGRYYERILSDLSSIPNDLPDNISVF